VIIQTTTNRVCLPIISMFLLVLGSSRAEAKGLLMLDYPTQYVEFAYSLQNSDTRTTQRLTPSYGLTVPFAILDPTFLVGSLGGSVNFTQSESSGSSDQSSSSSKLGYQYNAGGILLKETATPFNFYANSTDTTSQQDFSPNSTVTYSTYGINGLIKSKILPVSYSYRHDDSKTDVENSLSETVQDAANVILTHRLNNLMTTSVNGAYLQTKNTNSFSTANTTANQTTLNINNTLLFTNIYNWLGTLSSDLFIQNVSGTYPIETRMLTESYDSSLGKGLLLGASYTIGSTKTTLQSQQVRAGQVFLEHRLFDSLRTRLTGSFNNTDNGAGEGNSITSGTAQMIYTKKFPKDAVLQLEASDGITVRDSKLNSSLQSQQNEQISVVSISQLYPLKNPRVVQIFEVRNKNTSQLFLPNVDYDTLVIGQTTFITINPAGGIHTGDVILVTYEFQSDPSIKYSTNTASGSASYTLFNGRYQLQTMYSESSSTLLSGGQGSFAPPESKLFRTAARANLENLIMGAEYRYSDNFSTRQDTFEEFVYYNRLFDQNNLGLQVSHSYNIYSPTGSAGFGTSGELTSNTLTIGTNWSRPLFLTGRMLLTTNYQRVWGTLPTRDYLSARFAYDLPLGKFSLHLDASSVLRIMDNASNSMNNYLNLSIRRYF
jgi:hypothetical protein